MVNQAVLGIADGVGKDVNLIVFWWLRFGHHITFCALLLGGFKKRAQQYDPVTDKQ